MCMCKGMMKVVFGLLLLVNAFIWPKWVGIDGWIAFVAVLMVLFGALKLLMPSCDECECNNCSVSVAPTKKRKR